MICSHNSISCCSSCMHPLPVKYGQEAAKASGPGHREGHLVVGEDAEGVDVDLGGEPGAGLVAAGNNARHKGAVPQPVLQRRLVRPVRALPAPALTAPMG